MLFALVKFAARELLYWFRYVIYTYIIVVKVDDHLRLDVAQELAVLAHDKWWQDYRSKYPLHEAPARMKTIPSDEGGQEIDINHCSHNCPAWVKYQADLVHIHFVAAINLAAPLDYNADMVHRVWMDKNEWERNDRPYLFVRFDKLSFEEKEKDRDIVRIILAELAK